MDTSTGASFCFIAGHEIPFDDARLNQLYTSHGDYVTKVKDSVNRLVRERFLTPADGLKLQREAAQSQIP